jgi:hypothetical protein
VYFGGGNQFPTDLTTNKYDIIPEIRNSGISGEKL